MMFDRRLMTEKEVAEVLAVSVKTLQDWRRTGLTPRGEGLPFIKMGRSIRYDKADLELFINAMPRVQNTGEADNGLSFLLVESSESGREN